MFELAGVTLRSMTTWEIRREGELGRTEHAELATMLRAAYPDFPTAFTGELTWYGSRPEARVIGKDGDRVIAHAGVLRRFVRISEGGAPMEVLVGNVGLVAVHPESQGRGIGRELGTRVTALLDELAVPFGLLMCGEHSVGYYEALGWSRLPEVHVRYLDFEQRDPYRVIDEQCATTMVLPVRVPLRAWPMVDRLDWAGSQV
ncbi:GNAT family N-acetyltransferase [Amycolatopsis magusensis]|uniref:GNAT family N-acetyltransferase n=1 Tax=Amycolatopsis magusensis TaxID=882444 RepID=UPI0037AD0220